jgi:hypothetical protein
VALGAFAGTTDGRVFIEQTGVCIHDIGKRGIEASGQAFVRITNSEVHHTGGDAVSISEGSAADIGFDSGGHYTNFFTTAFPGPGHSGPNNIHDTLGSGINLQHGSEARIYGNHISTNAKSGISLVNHSQGDVGYNLLNGNTLFGISATDNSNVNLGTSTKLAPNDCPADPLPQGGSCNGTSVDAGTQANKVNSSLFANSVTVGNLKGGIQCGAGAAGKNFAVIAGKSSLGSDGLATTSLNSNGAVGANDISAGCTAAGVGALN